MRIGLYGLPTAGKTFILDAVRNYEVLAGSFMLKELAPNFQTLTVEEKTHIRKQLAMQLRTKDDFIMDGHYSFGNEVVFTDEDGELYDAFLYLYVDPAILKKRMEDSVRNNILPLMLKNGRCLNWNLFASIAISIIRISMFWTIREKAISQM